MAPAIPLPAKFALAALGGAVLGYFVGGWVGALVGASGAEVPPRWTERLSGAAMLA